MRNLQIDLLKSKFFTFLRYREMAWDHMFLMTYLKFASNVLSLDMGSFEKIYIVIVLGGKRLLWKPMGNDLVYSSLY